MGDKGVIYTTPQSNGNYYFRTWIKSEKFLYRKSLRTKNLSDAKQLAEEKMVSILAKILLGQKIHGFSWGELCQSFMDWQTERVETDRITLGRFKTMKTQVNKHIIPFLGSELLVNEINKNSFLDFGLSRRKKNPEVTDSTIRNEYTTINFIFKYGYRHDYTTIPRVEVDEKKIKVPIPVRFPTHSGKVSPLDFL